jgi:uncharacterized FlaG/YvyC family protein
MINFDQFTPDEIPNQLDAICHSIEDNYKYTKKLTQEELESSRHILVEMSQKLQEVDDEFKEIKGDFQAKIKDMKDSLRIILRKLRFGIEEQQGRVYLVDDQEAGRMYYITEQGDTVFERPLYQNERQLIIKTGKLKAIN